MPGAHTKVEWISAGEQQFRALEEQNKLDEKTVMELRDMDPWEFEGAGYRCPVTIAQISDKQMWWFSSCTKCHRASAPSGNHYRCFGGCPCTTAEPKYRLTLIGTDGTASAEFTLFGRVARQVVGMPVVSLIRSASRNQHGSSRSEFKHKLPELTALVSQKFTFSVSISQKNLTWRNVSFQVNSVVTFFGKQTYIPQTNELTYDHSHSPLAMSLPPISDSETTGASTPSKKARLDRKIIPCKKTLNFGITSRGTGQPPCLSRMLRPVTDAGENLLAESTEAADMCAQATVTEPSVATEIHDKNAETIPKEPHDIRKCRSIGGKKKLAL